MSERDRRIARARLLRRQGKTYDEIRQVIGAVADSTLRIWCRGIPRPPQTRRSHPKLDDRARARRLRSAGSTYDEIARELNVSKGSLSLWLRGQPGPGRKQPYNHAEHLKRIQPLGARSRRERAAAARAGLRTRAARQLAGLSPDALLVAGAVLYWAEGAKDKPWRRNGCVVFINNDPEVLETFLAWLDLVGVPEEDRRYRLQIHETADVDKHERWWAHRLGISTASFGCLIVRVLRSGWLCYSIAVWWSAIVSGAAHLASGGKLDSARSPVG